MEQIVPYALAFLFGALFSVLDLISVRYRRVSNFIYSSPFLYLYAILFGVFGITAFELFKRNLLQGTTLSVPGSDNIYIEAIAIGILTKAFCDVKIFSLSLGSERTFPVGIKTIGHFIEEPLLFKMDSDWFKQYRRFIAIVEVRYQNKTVDDIHNLAVDGLKNFPDKDRALVFLTGAFAKASTKSDKYSLVMREFGKAVFSEIFLIQ